MTNNQIISALNNAGLPQLAVKSLGDITQLNKKEIKTIIEKINEFDKYYKSGWKQSKTREVLTNVVNEYVTTFRCYSILN